MSMRVKDPAAETSFNRRRKRSLWRKRLDEALTRAEAGQFLQLMWSLRAIDRGEFTAARKYGPRFDQEQLAEAKRKLYFSPWTLETLVNEYLCKSQNKRLGRFPKILNVSRSEAAYYVVNAMRQLENAEEGLWLQKGDVLHLVGHLAQRQFPWQRGFMHFLEFYRPLYIFDFEEAKQEFMMRVGVSMETFARCGFALMATSLNKPFIRLDIDLDSLGVKEYERDVVINHLSLPIPQARKSAIELRRKQGMAAYKPSALRQYPFISFPSKNVAIAPLPELVSVRIADGIFYDLAGSRTISSKVGRRFEQYVAMIIREYLSNAVEPINEVRYHITKALGYDTPDLRLKHEGEIFLVVECKARRVSHHSRFADSPAQVEGLDELAHGVFQIWRYFSHVRRGLFAEPCLSASAAGALLTLDTWADMSETNRKEILQRASKKCADTDPEITSADMRPIAFLHIRDVEGSLASASPRSFRNALKELLVAPQYMGWSLRTVHDRQNERIEQDIRQVFNRLPRPQAILWWPELGD